MTRAEKEKEKLRRNSGLIVFGLLLAVTHFISSQFGFIWGLAAFSGISLLAMLVTTLFAPPLFPWNSENRGTLVASAIVCTVLFSVVAYLIH